MPFKRQKKKLDKSRSTESLNNQIELIHRDESGMFPSKKRVEVIDDDINVSSEDIENFLQKPNQNLPVLEKAYRDKNGMFSSESKKFKSSDDNKDKITGEDIERFLGKPKKQPDEKELLSDASNRELSNEIPVVSDLSADSTFKPTPPKIPIPPPDPNIGSIILSPRNKRLAKLKRPHLIKEIEPSEISLASAFSIKSQDSSIGINENELDIKSKESVNLESNQLPENDKFTLSNGSLPMEIDDHEYTEKESSVRQNNVLMVQLKKEFMDIEAPQEAVKQPSIIDTPLFKSKSIDFEPPHKLIKKSSSNSSIARIRNSKSIKKSESSSNISLQESSLSQKQFSSEMSKVQSVEQSHGLPPLPKNSESRSASRSSIRKSLPNEEQTDLKINKTSINSDLVSKDIIIKARKSWSDSNIAAGEGIKKVSSKDNKTEVIQQPENKVEKLFRKSSKKLSKDSSEPKEKRPMKEAADDAPKKGWNIFKKSAKDWIKNDVEISKMNLSGDSAINDPKVEEKTKRKKSKSGSKKRSKEVLNSDTNEKNIMNETKLSRESSKRLSKDIFNGDVNTSNVESKLTRKRSNRRPKESNIILANDIASEDEKLNHKSSKKLAKERKSSEKLKKDLDIITNELKLGDALERSVSRGRRSKREIEDIKNDQKELSNKEIVPLKGQKDEEPSPVGFLFKGSDYNIHDFANDSISIKIHRSDSLISLLNLRHPMVQVHIVDINTGQYLLKTNINKAVTFFTEPLNVPFILPTVTKVIITYKPYFLLKNRTKTPIWEEQLLFDESYLHIMQPNVIILFEIVDFLISTSQIAKNKGDKWQRVAWAFLKTIGQNGQATTEKKVRLQLYKYPTHIPVTNLLNSSYVFRCWNEPWVKYPSTLFVTVSGNGPIKPPIKKIYHDESPSKLKRMGTETTLKSFYDLSAAQPKWRRKNDEICNIPNKLLYRINAGSKGSFSCSFSNNGVFLAIAGADHNSYPVKVYHFETGERIATLDGHLDLIYQLSWSRDDCELISSSSDGSVRVWGFMADGSVQQVAIFLHPTFVYCASFHPIESEPSIIASGCYDGHIRLWKHFPNDKSKSNKPFGKLANHGSNVNALCFGKEGQKLYSGDGAGVIKIWIAGTTPDKLLNYECIKTIDSLTGNPIQSMKNHVSNRKLLIQTSGPSLHVLDTRIHKFLTHFLAQPITSLNQSHATHPIKFGLPCRPIEPLNQITSAKFLRSSFSACGEYVFSGSKMGGVHIWRSESGAYIGEYKSTTPDWIQTNSPIVDISFHPHDHAIAFSVWGTNEPVMVFTWDEDTVGLKETSCIKKEKLPADAIVAKGAGDALDLALAI